MRYVSPLGSPGTDAFPLAPAPSSLEGQTLGLLTNGKPNADVLLRTLADELVGRYKMKDVLFLDKSESAQGPGFPGPDWMVDTLSSSTVAVLTASGD